MKAKQEVARIERLIAENETKKREAEAALAAAQGGGDYRQMQQLYESVSAL